MSKQEAVICPFCGAPYPKDIPKDVTYIKCKYCRSVILLPSNLSVVPRCPNHADTIAIGLCNDCMQAFCKKCLHLQRRDRQRIYLCPNCLRNRKTDEMHIFIVAGVVMFLISLFALQSSIYIFLVFYLIFSLPFIIGALYIFFSMKHAPHLVTAPTLHELQEEKEEKEKLGMVSPETECLYWMLWKEYVKMAGIAGSSILERRIHDYVNQGLTLEETIKKLAKSERII